jgi:hypothetical protein
LQIQTSASNAIADTATLSISNPGFASGGLGAALVAGAGTVDLGAGINETIYKLVINGSTLGAGTYGSTSSGAMFKNDQVFSGTGILTVLVPEPSSAALLSIVVFCLMGRGRAPLRKVFANSLAK